MAATQSNDKRKYASPRQLERQDRILATARDMLADVGYAGLTIRELARQSGVAQGTLYNLYNSKDELIAQAIADQLDGLAARAAARSQAGVDRILALGEETARQIQQTPEYAEAMARAVFSAQPDDPLTESLYLRGLPNLTTQLQAALQAGQIDKVDLAAQARHMQAQNWGVVAGWMLGMFDLGSLVCEYRRCQLTALCAIARGATATELRRQLRALL